MLKVRWEEEFQNSIHSYLGSNILELGRPLRDWKEEYISLLVRRLRIIGAMERIFNVINSINSS